MTADVEHELIDATRSFVCMFLNDGTYGLPAHGAAYVQEAYPWCMNCDAVQFLVQVCFSSMGTVRSLKSHQPVAAYRCTIVSFLISSAGFILLECYFFSRVLATKTIRTTNCNRILSVICLVSTSCF